MASNSKCAFVCVYRWCWIVFQADGVKWYRCFALLCFAIKLCALRWRHTCRIGILAHLACVYARLKWYYVTWFYEYPHIAHIISYLRLTSIKLMSINWFQLCTWAKTHRKLIGYWYNFFYSQPIGIEFSIFEMRKKNMELWNFSEKSCSFWTMPWTFIHTHTIKSRYFGQLCNCVDINVLLTLVRFLTHLNTRTYTHMYLVHNCLFFFFSRSLFFVYRRSRCLNFENRS